MMLKQLSIAMVVAGLASVAVGQEWGDLEGTFLFKGSPPTPAKINADKDPEYCGKHGHEPGTGDQDRGDRARESGLGCAPPTPNRAARSSGQRQNCHGETNIASTTRATLPRGLQIVNG